MAGVMEGRKPGESLAAYNGRLRREQADAVDALKLQPGEPIIFGGRFTRFDPKRHTRRERSYGRIRRLDRDQLEQFNQQEKEQREREERIRRREEELKAFNARPEVRAAGIVRAELDWNLERALAKLAPEEWIALAQRIEHKEGK